MMECEPARFAMLVARCWSPATASTYCAGNPAAGQCSVTALVAQDWLGGALAKTLTADGWHWYNILGGERRDFTATQFAAPLVYEDVPSDRAEAFDDTSQEQYRALSEAMRGLY